MSEKFWFGTEQHSEWVDVPESGADMSPASWVAEQDFLSGRGAVNNSWMHARDFQFTWPVSSSREFAEKLKSYADGVYGRGLIHFVDPLIYGTNALPAHWADPSMAVGRGASPLVIDTYPSAVDVPMVESARNLVTNPSMETSNGTVTVRTNLVTNPSFETNMTGWSANNASSVARSTAQAHVGTNSLLLTANGGISFGAYTSTISIAANAVYTFSIYVRDIDSSVQYRANIDWRNSGGGFISQSTGTATTVSPTGWTRLSITGTAPSTAAFAQVSCYSATAPVSGKQVYVDAAQLEVGSTASDYFDGSTSASGDFTYAWSGTAHASTSLQRGVPVTSYTAENAAVIQSSDWYSNGSKSMRIIPTSSTLNGSRAYLNIATIAGRTYTVKATFRQAATHSPTSNEARKIRVFNSTITTVLGEIQATNTVGIQNLSLTFVAADSSSRVYLWNGALAGRGDVFWDDLIVVEGTYTGDYFDGSTPQSGTTEYAWTGTANASQSIKLVPNSNDLPVVSAYYDLSELEPGFNETKNNSLFIPKPDGMNIALGAFYSAPDQTGLYVTPVYKDGTEGDWVRLTELAVAEKNNIVPDRFTDPTLAGLRLWAGKGFWNYFNLVLNPSAERVNPGTVIARRNLVTNPSFETDITGWSPSTATLSRVTSQAYVGSASMQIVTAGADRGAYISGAVRPQVVGGQTYTCSMYVKGEAGKLIRLQLDWYNGTTYVSQNIGSNEPASGSWQRIIFSAQAPQSANAVTPVIKNMTAGAHTFYVDAVLIEASSTAGSYFDGSTPGALGWDYGWSGTAHASISEAKAASTPVYTNLVPNPSMEASSGTVDVLTNFVTNPSMETASGTVTVRTNLITNPSMESVVAGTTPIRKNVIQNPSFETSLFGWSASFGPTATGTFSRQAGGRTGGGYCARMTFTTGTTAPSDRAQIFTNISGYGNVSPGVSYTASTYIRSSKSQLMYISIAWRDFKNTQISASTGSPVILAANTWTRISSTGIAPSEATGAQLGILCPTDGGTGYSNWNAGDYFEIDDILVEGSNIVGDYFDGATTDALGWDYAWDGVTNESSSSAKASANTVATNLVTNPSQEFVNTGTFVFRQNLMKNPSIETKIDGWGVTAGTGGTASIARVAGGVFGGFEARATWTVATTGAGGILDTVYADVLPYRNYVGSAYVKSSKDQTVSIAIQWRDSAKNNITNIASSTYYLKANTWTRLVVSGVSPANAAYAQLYSYTSSSTTPWQAGDWYALDAAMIENASNLNDYYDGSIASSLGWTYDWVGVAHESVSNAKATNTIVRTNLCTNPSFETNTTGWAPNSATISRDTTEFYIGSASMKAVFTASADNGPTINLTGSASRTYTASAWVKGEVGKLIRLRLMEYTAANVYIGESSSGNITATGSWQRISVSRTFGSTAGQSRIALENRTTGAHTFYVDAVMLEASPTMKGYFDGTGLDSSNIASGSYVYGWTGTAHASTSVQYAATTAGWVGAGIVAPSNIPDGAKFGKSVTQVIARSLNSDQGDIRFNASSATTFPSGIVAGGTYTMSAWINTPSILSTFSQTSTSRQRRILYFYSTDGSTFTAVHGTQGTNTTGWQEIKHTFTVPSNATGVILGVGCAGSATDPEFITYVDGVQIVAGEYSGNYFDGSISQDGDFVTSWSGTAHASTSLKSGAYVAEALGDLAIATESNVEKYVGSDSTLITWNSGTASGGGVYMNSARIPVTSSSAYALSGYMKPGTFTGQIACNIEWWNALTGGTKVSTTSGTATSLTAGTWTRLSVTGAVPAGATHAVVTFYATGIVPIGQTAYLDAVLFENSSVILDYFDGSTTASGDFTYAWSSAAHASTSLQRGVGVDGVGGTYLSPKAYQTSAGEIGKGLLLRSFLNIGAIIRFGSYTLSPSKVYTVKVSIYNSSSSTASYTVAMQQNSGAFSIWTLGTAILASGWNTVTFSGTPPTGFDAAPAGFIARVHTSSYAEYFVFDSLLIVEGNYAGSYFDGSTTASGDFTYVWSGTANASTSIARATNVANLNPVPLQRIAYQTANSYLGSKAARFMLIETSSIAGLAPQLLSLTTGTTYTMFMRARANNRNQIVTPRIMNTNGTPVTLTQGVWTDIRVTLVAGSGSADQTGLLIASGSGHQASDTIDIDTMLVIQGNYTGPYFDGSNQVNDSFSYAWSGAANASTSIMSGVPVSTYNPSNSVQVSSFNWYSNGSNSIMIIPSSSTSNDSFININGDGGAIRLGMQPSKTYTVKAKIRLDSEQTGTINGRGRKIVIFTRIGAGSYVETHSNQASNAAGVTELKATFTVPEGATEAFIRLYNGAFKGNGNVWYDDIILYEEREGDIVDVPYFDGDTTDTAEYLYRWTGQEHNSTSYREAGVEIQKDITISAINARYYSTSTTPLNQSGPWFSGLGNTGTTFVGKPTRIVTGGMDDGQISVSATLKEIGDGK